MFTDGEQRGCLLPTGYHPGGLFSTMALQFIPSGQSGA
jgi:hypothetical protein